MDEAVPQPETVDQHADPVALAYLGRAVAERLGAIPGVDRVDVADADLFVIPGFLGKSDCRDLVRVINSQAVPSTLYRGTEREGFRTSWTHHFGLHDPLTLSLETYISDVLGIDNDHSEVMQGQRYRQGQQYKHHHDFFHVGQGYWQAERLRGGQRTFTAMIFLNEPAEGGETDFPKLGIALRPQAGTLCIWNNMDRSGHPNMKTLHAGMPVRRGVKHVITKWYRLDPWRRLNAVPSA